MIIKRNRAMEVNDLISRFFNFDFDGDSMIATSIQSKQAQEDFDLHFVKNLIEFEHMDEPLIDFEHESIYSAYMLSLKAYEKFNEVLNSNEFKENKDYFITDKEEIFNLKPDFFIDFNNALYNGGNPMIYEDRVFSFFELIVNKVLGIIDDWNQNKTDDFLFYSFEKYGILNKKNLYKLVYDYIQYLKKINEYYSFWDRIHIFNKFLLEAGTRLDYSIASFNFKDFVVDNEEIHRFKEKLIQNEPFLAFHQNMLLFEEYILPEVEKNKDGILNTLFKSGARLKSVQLLKAASNSGIPTDIYGRALPINIKNSLLDGLTKIEYFLSGDSARLALQQRQDAIPKGGELQRKFFFVTGIVKQNKEIDDCHKIEDAPGKHDYFEIEIKNEKYLKTLKHRWYKLPEWTEEKVLKGNEKELIGKKILLRSPITCKLDNYQVCKKCLGVKRPETANLGAPTGQYLSEAIVQSVLRAHHFGGVFLADIKKEIIDALKNIEILETTTDYTRIQGKKEYIEIIKNYLLNQYNEDQIELHEEIKEDTIELLIIVHEMPFSEDAVKILNDITSLIDKNKEKNKLIPIEEVFDKLVDISDYNNILNLYFEIVLSLLFYDEDNVLYRYTEKPIVKQLSLKDVINNIDPKLNIFYNFSNKTIQKIFEENKFNSVDHMYRDLVKIYK